MEQDQTLYSEMRYLINKVRDLEKRKSALEETLIYVRETMVDQTILPSLN